IIARSIEIYQTTFDHFTKRTWEEIRQVASEFMSPIESFSSSIASEIRGVAAGARLTVEDVLALNARTELMYGLGAARAGECTSFYVGPRATDDHVVLAQNWDWLEQCDETTILLEVDQGEDRPNFITLVEAGLVGKMGFNSAGIGVVVNLLVSNRDQGERLVPVHVLLRRILDAKSIEEAVATLAGTLRASSGNYMIASSNGTAVNVEAGPGGIDTLSIIHPTDMLLWHANDFTCAVGLIDLGHERMPDSQVRYASIGTQLREYQRGARTGIKPLLSLHEGFPGSVCHHQSPDNDPLERVCTLAGWIVDLTTGEATVCRGRPCESEFYDVLPRFSMKAAWRRR